jgi:hypothetical protein
MDTNSRLAVLEERVDHLKSRVDIFEKRLWILGLAVAGLSNAVDLWTLFST